MPDLLKSLASSLERGQGCVLSAGSKFEGPPYESSCEVIVQCVPSPEGKPLFFKKAYAISLSKAAGFYN